jgi:hypothetical protein
MPEDYSDMDDFAAEVFGPLRAKNPPPPAPSSPTASPSRRPFHLKRPSRAAILLFLGLVGAIFQVLAIVLSVVAPFFGISYLYELLSIFFILAGNLGAPLKRKVLYAVIPLFIAYWAFTFVAYSDTANFIEWVAPALITTLLSEVIVAGSFWKKGLLVKFILPLLLANIVTICVNLWVLSGPSIDEPFQHLHFVVLLLARLAWAAWWAHLCLRYPNYKEEDEDEEED